VLASMTNHVVKAAVDVATVGSGLNRLMRQRLRPVSPALVPQWRELSELLRTPSNGSGIPRAPRIKS